MATVARANPCQQPQPRTQQFIQRVLIVLVVTSSWIVETNSFVIRGGKSDVGGNGWRRLATSTIPPVHPCGSHSRSKGAITSLQLSPLSTIVTNISSKISPPIRNSILIGSAAALLFKNRSKLYPPNLEIPDPSFSEPLPDGSLGCPYLGNIGFFTRMGNAKTGSGEFYHYQASLADGGNPQLFKYAPLGTPSVVITGITNVKKIFNQEFKLINAGILSEKMVEALGGESLVFVTDQGRHQFLRKLVGQSMTPEQIDKGMPALMKSATRMINTLKQGEDVEMERVVTAFTLDVAWRQILGEITI